MTAAIPQIAFRYRMKDSATGVTRSTAKRLADALGVDETDDGALSKSQLKQIKKSAPKVKNGVIRSSLFNTEMA